MGERGSGSGESVRGWPFDAVDHENGNGAAFGMKLEPELFLYRGEHRRKFLRGGR